MASLMEIRREAPHDVLDFQQLVSLLRGYAKPRDRIGSWLARGELVRVRKGLYVLGEPYRHGPVSRMLLANLIYGPSYVSLDYALGYHGLIPERVEDVTSVTTGKTRRFVTPFGAFSYRSTPLERYTPGMLLAGEEGGGFLVASPEKALVDKVWSDKRFRSSRRADLEAYLLDDLRLDEDGLRAMDLGRLAAIAGAFSSPKIDRLVRFVERLAGDGSE